MVDLNIDVSGIDPSEKREYPQLPRGWYSAYIDESMMKDAKSKINGENNNEFLQLRFVIMDWMDKGPAPEIKFTGRKFFARLNLINANSSAVEIAYRNLAAIGKSIGVTDIKSSDLLHDKPLEIFLEETLNNKNQPDNEILYFRACDGGSELSKVAQANQSYGGNGADTSKPIWEN